MQKATPGPRARQSLSLLQLHIARKCSVCSCDISRTWSAPQDNGSGYQPWEGDLGAVPLGRLSGTWRTFRDTRFPGQNYRCEPGCPARRGTSGCSQLSHLQLEGRMRLVQGRCCEPVRQPLAQLEPVTVGTGAPLSALLLRTDFCERGP